MLQIDNQTNIDVKVDKINSIYDSLTQKDLELIFVDDIEIKKINNQYRSKNYPTDVLSFPLVDMPHSPLGTIIISLDRALHVSHELGHSVDDEISLLFIHGFLHVSGYDHEIDSGEMRQKEEELIKKFNLPKSLIVRTLNPN